MASSLKEYFSRIRDQFITREDTVPFVSSENSDEARVGNIQEGPGEIEQLEQNPAKKTWLHLARLSGAVCGIEFCYAAETAFVSPILLRIGIPQRFMTMVWCLSPMVGFVVMPLLGPASDQCRSRLGRRRPFIILLSVGIVLGLLLVPNGYSLGSRVCGQTLTNVTNGTSCNEDYFYGSGADYLDPGDSVDVSELGLSEDYANISATTAAPPETTETPACYIVPTAAGHTCGLILTVLGVILLDFNCDACQSPARAYLIDVTHPSDHVRGLSMFSFMAGIGGSIGYMIGGIPWEEASGDDIVGAQIRFVFGLVLIIFIIALIMTVTAEREKTLEELFPEEEEKRKERKKKRKKKKQAAAEEEMELGNVGAKHGYGTRLDQESTEPDSEESGRLLNGGPPNGGPDGFVEKPAGRPTSSRGGTKEAAVEHAKEGYEEIDEGSDDEDGKGLIPVVVEEEKNVTIKTYFMSIIHMPNSLRILCCTHLLGWMSLLCYSLYFTDFVGQVVYGGSPYAEPGTPERYAYAKGVRIGSFAMGLYSFTCAVCSFCLERMIAKVGAKFVYISNHLVYSFCMACMALFRSKWAIFIFSASAGIQYSTLFTLPFILLARYHSTDTFSKSKEGYEDVPGAGDREYSEHAHPKYGNQIRGLGTDIAVVQSMVFFAQFILSLCMGSIVQAVGSPVAVVVCACILSFFGSLMASRVLYAGL